MDKNRFDQISSSFSQQSILVIGDVMLDKFMWGNASRISPCLLYTSDAADE